MKRSLLIFALVVAAVAQGPFRPPGPAPAAASTYPQKGAAYSNSRAAVINSSGKIDGASGNSMDCVKVNGTSGPCGAGANPAGSDGDIQAKDGTSLAARTPQGTGSKVQMATGSAGAQYTVIVYDSDGNAVSNIGGCTMDGSGLSCGDGTASTGMVLSELAANGSNYFAIYGADSQAASACIILSGQGTSGQVLSDSGSTATTTDGKTCHVMQWSTPGASLFPVVLTLHAGLCDGGSGSMGDLSFVGTTFTKNCVGGSNNKNGDATATPSTGAVFYGQIPIPANWSTSNEPFGKVYYDAGGSNSSGTVIWTMSVGCTKSDGSTSQDPPWIDESAMSTQTITAADRSWAQSAQFSNVTSGNGCVPGGILFLKGALSGTASSAIRLYMVTITFFVGSTVQAQ